VPFQRHQPLVQGVRSGRGRVGGHGRYVEGDDLGTLLGRPVTPLDEAIRDALPR